MIQPEYKLVFVYQRGRKKRKTCLCSNSSGQNKYLNYVFNLCSEYNHQFTHDLTTEIKTFQLHLSIFEWKRKKEKDTFCKEKLQMKIQSRLYINNVSYICCFAFRSVLIMIIIM